MSNYIQLQKAQNLRQKSLRNFAKWLRWKHLIFIELFGMDENGFGALILLIPKNYDQVRKLTLINRQHLSSKSFSAVFSWFSIAARKPSISGFSQHCNFHFSLTSFSPIFWIFANFWQIFLRFSTSRSTFWKKVYIDKCWFRVIFLSMKFETSKRYCEWFFWFLLTFLSRW